MAYRSFTAGPVKGLHKAEASSLPDFVVIVGPNGSGKSTLLYELWRNRGAWAEPGTRVMYINPNRPWRRSTLPAASLFGLQLGYRQLMETDAVPGFQYVQPTGYVHTGQPRSPDTTDDAQGLVKFAIVRMETQRQRFISQVFDASDGRVDAGAVPDVFGPLRELIEVLLPHLHFIGVDTSNDSDQRCLFRKLDAPAPVTIDIDDLSSGEKAVIQLFLPFIESQIEQLLKTGTPVDPDAPRPTAIIDEPDLHLHPSLQVGLVAYMRRITQRRDAQFIVATHSTAIMDALEDDELFVLAPPSSVGVDSQLRRLAATSERLEVVREITGSTHVVTRCRPIVFIEGERPGTKVVSDQRVVELLVPEAKRWVLVPAKGRTQAIGGATALRDPTLTELPGIAVFALVDKDEEDPAIDDFIVTWSVCMMENLLLEPAAIWELVEPFRERIDLKSADALEDALRQTAEARVEEEIQLRVLRRLRQPRFDCTVRTPAEAESLMAVAQATAEGYLADIGGVAGVTEATDRARNEVQAVLDAGEALQRFHGKAIMKRLFEEHIQAAGWSYATFIYQLAQRVSGSARVMALAEGPVRRVRQFLPASLTSTVAGCRDVLEGEPRVIAHEAVAAVAEARAHWEQGTEDPSDRAALRKRLLDVGRAAHEGGHSDLYQRLVADLVQLGDG